MAVGESRTCFTYDLGFILFFLMGEEKSGLKNISSSPCLLNGTALKFQVIQISLDCALCLAVSTI